MKYALIILALLACLAIPSDSHQESAPACAGCEAGLDHSHK
jgi:hypothetical protein